MAGLSFGGLAPAEAEGTGTISATAFEDLNRDGARQPGETPFQGHRVHLYGGDGTYLAYTATDASGRYAFSGLADAAHRVEYAPQTWWEIREALVPTSTGTIRPTHHLVLSGRGTAPVSEVVMETGLRVASYNDAVTAQDVADAPAQGRLLGDEARHTKVRFAYGTTPGWTAPTPASKPPAGCPTCRGSTAAIAPCSTSTAMRGATTTPTSSSRTRSSRPATDAQPMDGTWSTSRLASTSISKLLPGSVAWGLLAPARSGTSAGANAGRNDRPPPHLPEPPRPLPT